MVINELSPFSSDILEISVGWKTIPYKVPSVVNLYSPSPDPYPDPDPEVFHDKKFKKFVFETLFPFSKDYVYTP